jgi:hypothetical protein
MTILENPLCFIVWFILSFSDMDLCVMHGIEELEIDVWILNVITNSSFEVYFAFQFIWRIKNFIIFLLSS